MRFLYFVPTDRPPNKPFLVEIGFPHAALAALPGVRVTGGPGGQNGYVFRLNYAGPPDAQTPTIGYYKDIQTWQRIKRRNVETSKRRNGETTEETSKQGNESPIPNPQSPIDCWVGWLTAGPPRPVDLQRGPDEPSGHAVTLRDGHEWMVAVARQASGGAGVPQVFGLDEHGEAVRCVAPEHEALWRAATRVWDRVFEKDETAEGAELDWDEAFAAAALALGANYVISVPELRARGLLAEAELIQVLRGMVDYPLLEKLYEAQKEAQKKTDTLGTP